MNLYIISQCNYCPLVWMCHNRTLNNIINKVHERALRIIYNDHNSSFKSLLKKETSFTIHENKYTISCS